ncbi:MAG TPA: hypothetical protein VKR52_15920 [Terracidiphilus sp.]|nr:hypothetical protein [Terracidiphilus sp.]
MAVDDPLEALQRELDELNEPGTANKAVLSALSSLPLPWPFNATVERIKDRIQSDEYERIRAMIQTIKDVLSNHEEILEHLQQSESPEQFAARVEAAQRLLVDGGRKASVTRSMERVKRIGLILANGIVQRERIDEDDIEELMRVARELTDLDVFYLRELVQMQGGAVRASGRIERYQAYRRWEDQRWPTRKLGEIESACNKLEGYGLVSKIPPPNNINIMADMPNSYMLLPKGLHFVDLLTESSED